MRRMAQRVRAPVEAFLELEAAGGIVLLITAIAALAWANSPWHGSYESLWHTKLSIGIGSHVMEKSLHFWINEGLMTFFFLVVGLEIKRELVQGELSDPRRAALPVAAAIGGMLVPALIYFALNPSGPAQRGWGVPMATDIAFAVGILSLLGSRVPAALRILLLALAIIDDLGAILVIAFFYSSNIDLMGLAVVGLGLFVVFLWSRFGVRPGPLYLIPLGLLWAGLYQTGVHPTLAGVMIGLLTPVKPWLSGPQFAAIAQVSIDEFHKAKEDDDHHHLIAPLRRLSLAGREVVSPVVRGEAEMLPWVAFLIMPLFAFANAGVNLGGVAFDQSGAGSIMIGVAAGLVIGKPAGVVLLSWLSVKLGLCTLPRGIGWGGVFIVGIAAGIGFTMSIFIAELAFVGSPALLGLAKLAILIGTGVAAAVGLTIGVLILPRVPSDVAQLTPSQAERSTEY